MSVSTPSPMTAEMMESLRRTLGKPVARDERTALYDQMAALTSKQGGDMARAQGEPVKVEMHEVGDIKILSDGTRYQVTPSGWKKLDNVP